MTDKQRIHVATLPGSRYETHWVMSPDGLAQCVMASCYKDPQKVLVESGEKTLPIREGGGYIEAHEGDGIKLIFPSGTESRSRVRNQIVPTLMTGPVVRVIVRRE